MPASLQYTLGADCPETYPFCDDYGGDLIVSGGTVLDGQNEHKAGLFPNVANNPVVANPITSQPAKLVTQGLPEAVRVFVRGNPGIHEVENFPLHCPVKGLQVFFNP
jgi:hypothetical protein